MATREATKPTQGSSRRKARMTNRKTQAMKKRRRRLKNSKSKSSTRDQVVVSLSKVTRFKSATPEN